MQPACVHPAGRLILTLLLLVLVVLVAGSIVTALLLRSADGVQDVLKALHLLLHGTELLLQFRNVIQGLVLLSCRDWEACRG